MHSRNGLLGISITKKACANATTQYRQLLHNELVPVVTGTKHKLQSIDAYAPCCPPTRLKSHFWWGSSDEQGEDSMSQHNENNIVRGERKSPRRIIYFANGDTMEEYNTEEEEEEEEHQTLDTVSLLPGLYWKHAGEEGGLERSTARMS